MGKITQLVQDFLNQQSKTPVTFQPTSLSVGPGTQVFIPANPVSPAGTVDFIVQIRGIGDAKQAAGIGKNAVIITAEAGGMSQKNFQAYGNSNFINSAISQVLTFLQGRYPEKNIQRGKLTISSFSGGGQAVAYLIGERSKIQGGVDKFVFIDGLHTDLDSPIMKEVVNYAKEIKDNPQAGELSIVHSAVQTDNFPSTTETAEYIMKQLNLTKQDLKDFEADQSPAAVAQAGGLNIIQLYNKAYPYMVDGKVNVPGTAGWQHIQALKYGLKHAV